MLGGAGLAAAASPLLVSGIGWAAPGYTGDVLVVLSLRGGFDGLSALVPVADPAYSRLRPTIGVPAARTTALDPVFGLNVALDSLMPLWNAGDLAMVVSAGLTAPNRSHFAAMDEIERSAPGRVAATGWLDRLLSSWPASGAFDGVQIGSGGMPMAFSGPFDELAFDRVSDFRLSAAWNAAERQKWVAALSSLHNMAVASLQAPAAATLAALDTAAAVGDYTASVTYPDSGLGRTLRETAHIIKAGIGARVITVDEGDWDMHSDLGPAGQYGWMYNKLRDVAASIAAFFADLGGLSNGVTLVALSEFGRRVQENESGGLDHGWGNVMLVAGGNVNGSQVYGNWLGLSDLEDGDVRVTTDYRTVLADVLANRCGASAEVLSSVFPGFRAVPMGLTAP
jgi:uncharacterized protein (DUF1501 family)